MTGNWSVFAVLFPGKLTQNRSMLSGCFDSGTIFALILCCSFRFIPLLI
jgi:hypothetical protein